MEGKSTFPIPWSAWSGETTLDLTFSNAVNAELVSSNQTEPWTSKQIGEAIANPIEKDRIREAASGARSACIAVDDLARPTRAGDVLPLILEELNAAGVSPAQCSIVIAVGTHGALSEQQIEAKIGAEALGSGAAIEIHGPDKLAGTAIQYGDQELQINQSFLEADFKLGVSSVLPHSFAGFSGGAKMMLPGLSNLEATVRSHKFVQMGLRSGSGLEKNRFRNEIERLARKLGFEYTVCVLSDSRRRTNGVYAGDIVSAHRVACAEATKQFESVTRGVFDAMVLNAYPKDTDLVQAENALIAFKSSGFGVVKESGVIVICTAASELGVHGLFAPGGASYREPAPNRALRGRDLWIFAPNLSTETVRKRYWVGYRHLKSTLELEKALIEKVGAGSRVGVLPTAPMQQISIYARA